MKKLILTIAAIIVSASMYANKDVEASLCSKTTTVLKSELINCREVTLNNGNYKIISYSIGFVHKHDNTQDYIEFVGVSEKIDESFADKIKKCSPDMLYLEKVIVVNESNEKFTLGPVKIRITQ